MTIDPVEQRPRQAGLVIARAARIAVAALHRIAGIAAAARVHRGDELDPRRERHVRVRPGNVDLPRLQRLAQRIEHRALEFGQLVEEQDAQMRQADFARSHFQTAARQCRHAGRMVRRAKRSRPADAPGLQRAGDRLHHRHFQRFFRCEFGQDPGKAAGEQGLARSRRPHHQEVVTARRRDLQRALGGFLPLHLLEIGCRRRFGDVAALRFGQDLRSIEVTQQPREIGGGEHRDAACPACFGSLRGGTDQPAFLPACMERGEQDTGRCDHSPVERQFTDSDPVAKLLGIGHAHRGQQGKRDRQVVMRPVLGQIGGRKVDRDALGRQRQPHRADSAACTRSRLSLTALSARPTTVKRGRPGATWHCTSTPRASSPR